VSYTILNDGRLRQGDIITGVYLFRKSPGVYGVSGETQAFTVMVFSRGCEIDKLDRPPASSDSVHVAVVKRLDTLSAGTQGNLKANKVLNAWLIPPYREILPESYIDWRTLQPVDKTVLIKARTTRQYLCTLLMEERAAAFDALWDFLTRSDADAV